MEPECKVRIVEFTKKKALYSYHPPIPKFFEVEKLQAIQELMQRSDPRQWRLALAFCYLLPSLRHEGTSTQATATDSAADLLTYINVGSGSCQSRMQESRRKVLWRAMR